MTSTEHEIATPRGPAGLRITEPGAGEPTGLLVLGHGAGGGVDAPDLAAVHDAAVAAGMRVVLVTQPYRMAGRKVAAPVGHLDEAWTAVIAHLSGTAAEGAGGPGKQVAGGPSRGKRVAGRPDAGRPDAGRPGAIGAGLPMVFGGRSSGARVACRTAPLLGAAGVLALAFPLHPPGKPERSRAGELPVGLPTLVLNGDRDPFGVPEAAGAVEVVVRPGAVHDLRTGVRETAQIATAWLKQHGWAR